MAMGEARVPALASAKHKHEISINEHASLSNGVTVATSLMAGAVAGALAKTAIAPLDRTKINFQTSQTRYTWRAAVAIMVHSARTEGVLALWRGNSATMARIVPYAAIQFTAHEQWKRVLGVDTAVKAKQNRLRLLLAGSLAGVTSQSATYPLDMARARMAVAPPHEYRTLAEVFTRVWREEGARALYRGYPATVLGVIPYAGVSFYTYDTLKRMYYERYGGSRSAISNMVMGGCGGALAQTASYPLDIVRRRMQTSRDPRLCRTIAATVRYVYTTEGVRGFYKGLSMNWVKGPIAVGISFATYDAAKTCLRDLALAVAR